MEKEGLKTLSNSLFHRYTCMWDFCQISYDKWQKLMLYWLKSQTIKIWNLKEVRTNIDNYWLISGLKKTFHKNNRRNNNKNLAMYLIACKQENT
jgi:hypothetical protein